MNDSPGKHDPDTAAVHTAIEELWERFAAYYLGAEKQFDPLRHNTNQAFENLWKVTFDLGLPPQEQDQLLARLEAQFPGTLRRMHDIGHISEIEMEKGHAQLAIDEAKKYAPDRIFYRSPEANERIAANLERYREAARAGNTGAMYHHDGGNSSPFNTWLFFSNRIHYNLIEHFPYKTYSTLRGGEAAMLEGLEGLQEKMHSTRDVHLIVEAGALPETAIFDCLSRKLQAHGAPDSGQVLCVISDKESAELATQLIHELVRIRVLEKDDIRILNIDPLSDEFKTLTFTDKEGNAVIPYAATITQLVQGRESVETIARSLAEDQHINTFVVRGAHQMTRLLYEPMDHLHMPEGIRSCFTTVPPHAEISPADRAENAEVLQHTRTCYNTSHVYSSLGINRERLPSLTGHFQFTPARSAALDPPTGMSA